MGEQEQSASDAPINVTVIVTKGGESPTFVPPVIEGATEQVGGGDCACMCGSQAGGGSGFAAQ